MPGPAWTLDRRELSAESDATVRVPFGCLERGDGGGWSEGGGLRECGDAGTKAPDPAAPLKDALRVEVEWSELAQRGEMYISVSTDGSDATSFCLV